MDKEDTNPPYYLGVGEMNVFEKMKTYKDKYPLLYIRKKLWYIQQYISYICFTIINSWIFEAIALTVIVANSVVLALDNPTNNQTTETDDIIGKV